MSSLLAARIEAQRATALQADDSVRRFDVGARINGLVHVEAAVGPPAQRVQIVVRVLRAKPTQDDASDVRFVAATRVARCNSSVLCAT